MASVIVSPGVGHVNLAPDAFHRWATRYYDCRTTFKCRHPFSPVPYFLLCRALELQIKSVHLATQSQTAVKRKYGHNLMKAYRAMPASARILGASEEAVLQRADAIYSKKDFEYFKSEDALTAYKRYPALKQLDSIARKLLGL